MSDPWDNDNVRSPYPLVPTDTVQWRPLRFSNDEMVTLLVMVDDRIRFCTPSI